MKTRILLTAFTFLLLALPAIAGDYDKPAQSADGMPPMGPPAEMKELAYLEGEWDVAMRYMMEPGGEWMESSGISTYTYALGGGIIHATFKGEMMGMPMTGHQIFSYDREEKQYESIWVDSMACRTSQTVGQLEGDSLVLMGTDLHMGSPYEMKLTQTKVSADKFTFAMDMSMDGENWFTGMEMTYTKKSGAR